jgi:hypothetical protein
VATAGYTRVVGPSKALLRPHQHPTNYPSPLFRFFFKKYIRAYHPVTFSCRALPNNQSTANSIDALKAGFESAKFMMYARTATYQAAFIVCIQPRQKLHLLQKPHQDHRLL